MLTITKRLEFDAGHRIPDHKGQCWNVHGHRYVLEVTLVGEPMNQPGTSDHGMLMDFSDVTRVAREHLVDAWDHAFLVFEGDDAVRKLLAAIPNHKTVVLDRVPTVENLAAIAFELLRRVYDARFGNELSLTRIRLFETPNCWADCSS
ncbi:MAG: 6-carboxytetrahydropterin synthase [Burkholderiales bacterium]|nr:6-carboxytetrahydropterin synthase [Burkholderiales bacterium]